LFLIVPLYLRQSGGCAISAVCLCVILSVSRITELNNQPISSKLGCYDWAYQSEELINIWW